LGGSPLARADEVAYLVNVTVRPGYAFPGPEAALAYGHGVCDKIDRSEPYGQLIIEIDADFGTSNAYQAAYLVNQAANELCPASIWRLRQSAAGYRSTNP
jgi:hypothetical protein